MKRMLLLVILSVLYTLLEIVTWTCWLLDEIFYHRYHETIIKTPLYIVGMPRTATTLLYNALYADHDRFTTMKSWELLFAPTIIQKKAANLLKSADKVCRGALLFPVRKFDDIILKRRRTPHPVSLFGIEEDDIVLMHLFADNLMVFIFPRLAFLKDLSFFDTRITGRRKQMILWFYRQSLRKHLYVYGKGRSYLSKSPYHISKISSLREEFPDIRFICTFRKPEETIPSTFSLMHSFFKMYCTPVDFRQVTPRILSVMDHWYAYPLEQFRNSEPDHYLLVSYDDLARDPEKTIVSLYAHFGYSPSEQFLSKLSQINQENKSYKSAHVYSAADYSLDEEEIRQRYQSVYGQYLKWDSSKSEKKQEA